MYQCPVQLYVICPLVSILSPFPLSLSLIGVPSPCLHYYLLHIPSKKVFQSYSANQFGISESDPAFETRYIYKSTYQHVQNSDTLAWNLMGYYYSPNGQAIELPILETPNSKQLLTLWSLSSAIFECIVFTI